MNNFRFAAANLLAVIIVIAGISVPLLFIAKAPVCSDFALLLCGYVALQTAPFILVGAFVANTLILGYRFKMPYSYVYAWSAVVIPVSVVYIAQFSTLPNRLSGHTRIGLIVLASMLATVIVAHAIRYALHKLPRGYSIAAGFCLPLLLPLPILISDFRNLSAANTTERNAQVQAIRQLPFKPLFNPTNKYTYVSAVSDAPDFYNPQGYPEFTTRQPGITTYQYYDSAYNDGQTLCITLYSIHNASGTSGVDTTATRNKICEVKGSLPDGRRVAYESGTYYVVTADNVALITSVQSPTNNDIDRPTAAQIMQYLADLKPTETEAIQPIK